jgi:hypothetical protein
LYSAAFVTISAAPEQFSEISRPDWSRGPAGVCGHTFKLHFNCRSEAVDDAAR